MFSICLLIASLELLVLLTRISKLFADLGFVELKCAIGNTKLCNTFFTPACLEFSFSFFSKALGRERGLSAQSTSALSRKTISNVVDCLNVPF